jgi:hypothetical protein
MYHNLLVAGSKVPVTVACRVEREGEDSSAAQSVSVPDLQRGIDQALSQSCGRKCKLHVEVLGIVDGHAFVDCHMCAPSSIMHKGISPCLLVHRAAWCVWHKSAIVHVSKKKLQTLQQSKKTVAKFTAQEPTNVMVLVAVHDSKHLYRHAAEVCEALKQPLAVESAMLHLVYERQSPFLSLLAGD